MAQYKHLPIYKVTYELLRQLIEVTKEFPRDYKFTLGQKIKNEAIEMVVLIYKANSTTDRISHIEALMERLQVVELILRLCHDLRLIPTKKYSAVVEMTESLKQTSARLEKIHQILARASSLTRAVPGDSRCIAPSDEHSVFSRGREVAGITGVKAPFRVRLRISGWLRLVLSTYIAGLNGNIHLRLAELRIRRRQ